MSVICSNCTTVARTFSRGTPFSERSAQAVELHAVAELGPVRVVPVLQSPARVATDGLQVRVGEIADAHVGPRGRDDDAADPFQGLRVVDA
jgi:hypothetical protein